MLTTDGCLDLLLEPGVRRGERLTGALDDRVDRPGRELDPEQLAGELGRVTAGDAVADRERDDRRLQAAARTPTADAAGSSAVVRAAHSGQQTRCSRCSVTLTAIGGSSATWRRHGSAASTRSGSANTCAHDAAALGPMLDDLVDLLGRKQPPVPALVPGLAAPPRPERFPPGRGGADGGSCEGGSDEFRELRFSRRSSSATRASSRWFASTELRPPAPTATRQPSHDHHRGSPPPRPAPHHSSSPP